MRLLFWIHPEEWPPDWNDFTFLARAFQEVGKAMFAEWEDFPVHNASDCEEDGATNDEDDVQVGDEDDDEEEEEELQEARENERDRRRGIVRRALVDECRAGRLIAGLRPLEGGAIVPIDPALWNTELAEHRFNECKMSLDKPFLRDEDDWNVGTHWIFIQQEGLNRYLRSIRGHRPGPKKPRELSARRASVIAAYKELFPTRAKRAQVIPNIRDRLIHEWLKKNGYPDVSDATIRRALSDRRIGSERK